MVPKPRPCPRCKRTLVYSCVVPALCWRCVQKEHRKKQEEKLLCETKPDVTVEGDSGDDTEHQGTGEQ